MPAAANSHLCRCRDRVEDYGARTVPGPSAISARNGTARSARASRARAAVARYPAHCLLSGSPPGACATLPCGSRVLAMCRVGSRHCRECSTSARIAPPQACRCGSSRERSRHQCCGSRHARSRLLPGEIAAGDLLGVSSAALASSNPSSSQPVTPPIITLTGLPKRAMRAAARSAPLQ